MLVLVELALLPVVVVVALVVEALVEESSDFVVVLASLLNVDPVALVLVWLVMGIAVEDSTETIRMVVLKQIFSMFFQGIDPEMVLTSWETEFNAVTRSLQL